MVPNTYKIACAALDAVWQEKPSDSLGILLGGMMLNPNDDISMDAACLYDWKEVVIQAEGANELALILAYLDLDASRYRDVPDDLQHLIAALRTEGSREREIVDSVISTWHNDPESWPLYSNIRGIHKRDEESPPIA